MWGLERGPDADAHYHHIVCRVLPSQEPSIQHFLANTPRTTTFMVSPEALGFAHLTSISAQRAD
jgi:hypothetical protein